MKVRITAVWEVELEAESLEEAKHYLLVNDPNYWLDDTYKTVTVEELK